MASIPSTKVTEQDQQVTLAVAGYPKKRRTKKDFTIISNEILRDPALSKGAKLALIMLISYCWFGKNNCFPGQERLAQDLSKSVRTIRRYLTELKEKAYIKTVHRGLGKTNLYQLTIPANRPKVTDPNRPKVACPDRPKVAAESDESKHTQIEADEALSNSSKGMDEPTNPTCSHGAHGTRRMTEGKTEKQAAPTTTTVSNREADTTPHRAPSPPNRAEKSKIEDPSVQGNGRQLQRLKRTDEVMRNTIAPRADRKPEPPRLTAPPLTQEDMDKRIRERLAREKQREPKGRSPLSAIPPEHWQELEAKHPTTQVATPCKSKRQPVYEQLQVAIERLSEEFGDWKHVTSNITQSENIRREANVDLKTFLEHVYDARSATKYALATGKITKRDAAGQLVKMPYFFSVLRQRVGLPKVSFPQAAK